MYHPVGRSEIKQPVSLHPKERDCDTESFAAYTENGWYEDRVLYDYLNACGHIWKEEIAREVKGEKVEFF